MKTSKIIISREHFSWDFFFGENQDPKEEFNQKAALLQKCSRLVIFLAVFKWTNRKIC